jgi:hypothetical protein
MSQLLTMWMQWMLLILVPLAALSLAVYFCRSLFVFLVGERGTQKLLLCAFAPSTPLRELGHAMAAILFWQRVEDVCLLDVHNPEGELGFVERSYNPRNPIAQLGNLFYWVTPVLLLIGAVCGISFFCFGPVMHGFFDEILALAAKSAGAGEYFMAALRLLPAMLTGSEITVLQKLIGFSLLLLLCMGVFSSVTDVIESALGTVYFAALALAAVGILLLFDTRVQRMVMEGVYALSVFLLAMFLLILVCISLWLCLGAVLFLIRTLLSTGEEPPQHALQRYREDD